MIRRVKIENYKSLKAAEVLLNQLTVVLGPNAAGKSNLFDALNPLPAWSRTKTSRTLLKDIVDYRWNQCIMTKDRSPTSSNRKPTVFPSRWTWN
jgi:AAA15 family ATPase/GTPase